MERLPLSEDYEENLLPFEIRRMKRMSVYSTVSPTTVGFHCSRQAPGMGRAKRFKIPLLGRVRTENILLLMTLLAVIMGTCIGLSMNPLLSGNKAHLGARQLMYLKFPGEMFIRMLKMLIVPLVVASNISAIASLNAKAARLLTGLSLLYYMATTAIAVVLGITLATVIQPGSRHRNSTITSVGKRKLPVVTVVDSILDLIRNMIPDNLFVATFNKTQTKITTVQTNVTQFNNLSYYEVIHTDTGAAGTNILGLITFSILFGFAVHSLGPDAAVLADMFHAIRRVIIYLVSIVIWFSPLGIMCLIAEELAKTEDLAGSLQNLSLYVATVMSGLFIHGVFVLPLLLFLFTRRNPLKYAYNMLQALMTAVGTASSTATLPCTIRCLESGNQIDPRVTRFMLPLGTTINMDGTALFQAIATVYISQLVGDTLGVGELILVALTSSLASMAATSMPSAGMITIVMVLTAVGVPADKISFLYPVDWFLDRFRTMVNVFSDSVGAALVSHLCQHKLIDIPCDMSSLPEPEEEMFNYPGGLKEIELQDLEAAISSSPVPIPSQGNGDLQSHSLGLDRESNSSRICVMNDETIYVKF